MRPVAALLAFLLLASPLHAQTSQRRKPPAKTEQPVSPPPAPSGSIRGVVLCSDTHRPARGATIFIQPLASTDEDESAPIMNSMSRTGTDGSYSVYRVHPGSYIVLAIFPGYLSSLEEVQALSALRGEKDTWAKQHERLSVFPSITVDSGKTTTYDINLERGAAISGRVLYSDGSPAVQMPIQLEHADPPASAKSSDDLPKPYGPAAFTHQNLETDDLGRFRITALKPGPYRVAAMEADAAPIDYGDASYVTNGFSHPTAVLVYSGDKGRKSDATTYNLRAGEEVTGADITVALEAFHHVRGTLTSKDGLTINFAHLTLTSDGDEPITLTATVLADGNFDFPNVPPGTYTLAAQDAAIQIADPDEQHSRYTQMKIIHAFADGTSAVVVKDSDLLDVSLTLKEVPLKHAKKDDDEDEDKE